MATSGRLLRATSMIEPPRPLVEAVKESGRRKDHRPPEVGLNVPEEFAHGLQRDSKARRHFESLTDQQRRNFIFWINATRARHASESLGFLSRGRKPGMK